MHRGRSYIKLLTVLFIAQFQIHIVLSWFYYLLFKLQKFGLVRLNVFCLMIVLKTQRPFGNVTILKLHILTRTLNN